MVLLTSTTAAAGTICSPPSWLQLLKCVVVTVSVRCAASPVAATTRQRPSACWVATRSRPAALAAASSAERVNVNVTGCQKVMPSGVSRYAEPSAPGAVAVIGWMPTAVSAASAPAGMRIDSRPSDDARVPPAAPIVAPVGSPSGTPASVCAIGPGAGRQVQAPVPVRCRCRCRGRRRRRCTRRRRRVDVAATASGDQRRGAEQP